MSSATAPREPPDQTTRARIRDAAIARIAREGVAASSLRAVAADVGVSPGLVVHHFGGKEGLRRACDMHVTATIRERKRAAMGEGRGLDPVAALREASEGPPLLAYLARRLTGDAAEVRELVDELVEDAVGYVEEGVASGLLRPSEHPRGRAVVLTLWSLGMLALHGHARRHLDVDLLGPTSQLGPYALPAAEILSRGVFAEDLYERIGDAFASGEGEERE